MALDEECCGICDLPRSAHDNPDINHEFNMDGQLIPKSSKPKSPTPVKPGLALGRLIGMLANKGLLTPDEVASLIAEES